ncbi:uncharacterized protein LOC8064310 isoform X1 [Sorghum bicolor]|uniref:Uncharacterized protein n=2 Tax=Sorghum bicolor TaxID=4558 RepID=C5YLB9_SORBI|nr:uncharacterized protein LOC8064310 isoform X1 [Sorghum bicolor]XP_021320585.1 uncharacterized protein LOC8064310 isoform X1 [Sorghum bicolor]EES13174.1 hypothetical protein SORBI_3007G000200 [Sorghum bicolor]|eukprot:XP_002443679.1 uncharacterized protein LOC8064310 isoform X1 [Sorghum bicolor]
MPPEYGMPTRTAADAVVNRRPRRLFGRSSERKNPLNLQFERQVARLEARQQQQRCIIVTVIPFNFCYDFKSPSLTESASDDPSSQPTSPEESPETSSLSPSSPSILFLHLNAQDGSHRRWLDNSSRLLEDKPTTSNSMSDSDFLVNSFTKPSDNARHSSRRKSKKKSKKHRQRCRKPTDGSEAKFRESNGAVPAVDVGDCEDSTLSPKRVGDIRFEETSPSSSVKEISEEAPESDNDDGYRCCSGGSVSSASYCDEMELSRSAALCPALCGQCDSSSFRHLDNTQNSVCTGSSQETCYAGSSVNCNNDAKALFIFRNERGPDPCEETEFSSSNSGFDENWLEKSDYDSGICSPKSVGTCGGVQAAHLCSDTSSDNDFCLVISRKRARKEKKMSLWKSYGEHASTFTHDRNKKYVGCSSTQMTKEVNSNDCSHRQNHVGRIHPQLGIALKNSKSFKQRPSNVCRETQYGIPAKDSKLGASLNHFTGPGEKTCGKSTTGFDKTAQQLYLNRELSNALNSRESVRCETRSISSSEPTTPESKDNCTSESGESTDITIGALPMQKRRLQDSVRTDDASETISGRSSPRSESSTTELMVGQSAVSSVEGNHGCQGLCNSRTHLAQMLRVVNDAYKVQVAADVLLAAGYPISDLETFIYSATPVIGRAPCMISSTCSWDQVVSNSVCQHDISNVSLRRIWEWYEEPGCYGLEVKALSNLSSKTSCNSSSEFFAYFVPYLSAIQLFGWSRNNMNHSFGVQGKELLKASNTASSMSSHHVNAKVHTLFEESNASLPESSLVVEDHGELMFEYFETEQPSFRPPLFEKIKGLVSGANVSDHQIFGDPGKLQNAKLCELHPASWFCVAWYPVYRVPRGNFRAAFLTYHSLGKLVHQKCSLDTNDEHTRVVSPVVGLQSYNDKGEQWFQLRCPDLKQLPREDSSKTDPAEVHKERLRTLKMGALAMARAVVPKGIGESVNHHPDYEFFLSRCT